MTDRLPVPPGYLAYGHVIMRRERICWSCGKAVETTAGTLVTCDACRVEVKPERKKRNARNYWRRKRARRVIAEVLGV